MTGMKKEKTTDKKKTLPRLLANIAKNDRGIFALCAFYALAASVSPLLTVLLPKLLIGEITGLFPSGETIILLVTGYFAICGSCEFLRRFIRGCAYPRMTRLRIDYVRDEAVKLIEMDYKYTEDERFLSKYDRALEACSGNSNGVEGVMQKLFDLVPVCLTVLLLSVFIGIKSILIFAAILLNVAATAYAASEVRKYRYGKREELSGQTRRIKCFSDAAQDFAYGKDIRLYGLGDRVSESIRTAVSGYISCFRLIKRREYLCGLLTLLTLLLSDAAVYGVLTFLVFGGMDIADFSMYLVAATTLSLQMTALSDGIAFIAEESLYIGDFYEFLDADLSATHGDLPPVSEDDTLEIEFSHVTFRYPDTERDILSDFSLKIEKGERLAIVGINGAGKTTLVKLLTGLYVPDSGKITINGTDIRDFSHEAMVKMLSVVFQDVNVTAFTLAENVACKSTGIDRARVMKALDEAGLSEKVSKLKNGIDTMMLKIIEQDGTELSGGESQKLAIARALYKGGNAVIMDEPTSALDALAEAAVYEELSELAGRKTAIYISHRLASTKFCDRIALIDNGKLSEYGSHDELMALGGQYRNMFTVQGKYYRTEESI